MENHLEGLPEYGVLLTGSPENPVIENHSGRTIIAYSFQTANRNGRGPRDQPLLATSMQPAGIPDGGSLYAKGAMPVNPPGPIEGLASSALLTEPGPIIRASLRSVVFEDGEFVGTSEYGDFELFTGKMQGTREVGMMAKSGEWGQVEALAPDHLPPLLGRSPRGEDPILHFGRQVAALHLVRERRQKGHAAAMQLAEIYSSLPTLWK
jgi:hypothetical protein